MSVQNVTTILQHKLAMARKAQFNLNLMQFIWSSKILSTSYLQGVGKKIKPTRLQLYPEMIYLDRASSLKLTIFILNGDYMGYTTH